MLDFIGNYEGIRNAFNGRLWNQINAALQRKYHLCNKFPTNAAKKTYGSCVFVEPDGEDYRIASKFSNYLENPAFTEILRELIAFGISRYQQNYSNRYQNTNLVLYQKYTYEDACRLLNWERNEVPLNIGGYKFDKKTKTFPVFINCQ